VTGQENSFGNVDVLKSSGTSRLPDKVAETRVGDMRSHSYTTFEERLLEMTVEESRQMSVCHLSRADGF
jgi:hypothetical protein